jgi:hypothetical protein
MVRVDSKLLYELKEKFSETKNLNFTNTVDVLLRRLLKEGEKHG